MRIWYYILWLILSLALIVVGGLLRILHWPNGQNILILGILMGGIVVTMFFVKRLAKKRHERDT